MGGVVFGSRSADATGTGVRRSAGRRHRPACRAVPAETRIGRPGTTGLLHKARTYLATLLNTLAQKHGTDQHRSGAEALKFRNVGRCQ
ncbi:protein of unknown function [Methylorubrum extorquens]|uniref:Uncharacterized protein n=1 Tax=Methylorubrum extorquens TaxID=408 RepID=A0A2N9AM40_METEX|nr:protein of unknown function [Methylorubrum extorquens]